MSDEWSEWSKETRASKPIKDDDEFFTPGFLFFGTVLCALLGLGWSLTLLFHCVWPNQHNRFDMFKNASAFWYFAYLHWKFYDLRCKAYAL